MLKESDKAPRFSLESDAGERVSLSDFAGKTLVLYFYPKDDTSGCTREAQAFAQAHAAFVRAGASVVGVSRDSVATHCRFRDKYGLNFPLLSDPDGAVHHAYGAWGEKMMYGKKVEGVLRSTFVIEDGKIVKAFSNVKVEGHAEAVLASLGGRATTATPAKPATIEKKPGAKGAAAKTGAKKTAAEKKPPIKAGPAKTAKSTTKKKPAAGKTAAARKKTK